MNWKEFLKPDWKKIVIFVILFILFSFLMNNPFYIEDKGFPLVYLDFAVYGPSLLASGTLIDYRGPIFSIMNLVVDFIFWYLLSCLIIWVYNKVKKK